MGVLAAHLPAALSLWLLGAHALRTGQPGLAVAWGLAPLLFVLGRGWVRRAAQLTLACAVLFWARLGGDLVGLRLATHQPWLRLALILAGVLALAALGAALLERGRAAARYEADPAPHWPPALAMTLAVALLAAARAKVSFPVLIPDRFLPGSGWVLILLLGTYAAWLTRTLLAPGLRPRQWSRLRLRAWGLFSLVFFGQLALGLAGAERFLMTGALHLPVPALIVAGPLYRGEGLFMLILFLSTVAVVGPAWCSWLCYVGAWDGASCAGKKTAAPLPRWRPWVRAGLAALVFATAWGLRVLGAPMGVALVLAAGFGLAGVAVMLTASRRTGAMVHCTTVCPMGLVGNLLGRLHPLRVRIGEGCTGCGTCERVCRYDALDEARVAAHAPGLSCTLCGDCVSACPHDAMGYRFGPFGPSASRALFTLLVAGAHAAFLGLARI